MRRIKTTVVGSYPVPDWLNAAPSEQALSDAVRAVIGIQETAGIDLVCDGELSRFDVNHPQTNGMIEYFVRPMDGIVDRFSFEDLMAYRSASGMRFRTRPPGIVTGPLGSGSLDLPLACARSRAMAQKPFKFTLTGPHMLAKTLIDRHYGDIEALTHAMADVLAEQVRHVEAEVVQVDEANLPGSPGEWRWAAAAINKVLDAVRGTPAVHLCFGNYAGQTVQSGRWDHLLPYLDALHADHVVLEAAHRPLDEVAALRDLRSDLGLGLGVIDIKINQIETPEQIARRIEHAEQILGAGRVHYVHPDCGFWMLKRPIADAKILALAKGRDLFEGR